MFEGVLNESCCAITTFVIGIAFFLYYLTV
jgi:hypothetical protein